MRRDPVDVTAAAVKEAEAAIGLGYTSLKMKIGWHRPEVDLAWIEAVLDALLTMSGGANFEYDQEQWRGWLAAQAKANAVDIRRDQ